MKKADLPAEPAAAAGDPLSSYFAGLRAAGDPVLAVRRFLAARRPDTLRHVSRVAAAGRRLARRLGLPLGPVTLAATAHDLAAVVPQRDILNVAEALGVPLTEADRAIPQVVHGAVAAAVLRQALGVTDAGVLNAVTYHTTLRAGASPLEQVVFIADKLAYDPTSTALGYHPALWAARDTATLAELCWIYLNWVVRECPALGWRLHPHLLAAWEAFTPPRA